MGAARPITRRWMTLLANPGPPSRRSPTLRFMAFLANSRLSLRPTSTRHGRPAGVGAGGLR